MEVLIGLGLALLVVTLIGHGMWVFVAFIINSLSVPTPVKLPIAPVAPSRRKCVGCGALFAATFKNCPVCGEPAKPAATLSPQARLNGLQQELERLLADKLVTPEQFESAMAIVQESLDRLSSSSAGERGGVSPLVHSSQDQDAAPDRPVDMLDFLRAEAKHTDPEIQTAKLDAVVSSGTNAAPAKLDRIEKPTEPEPAQKRSAWTDWLQAFLEKKNIRWGELLAGLLIVGSSVGLVISLWATLRNAIPYFPALCFLGVTAAIHGAGLYTLRHWRLQTTSRGLLTIALLLVPLNFLAAIALSEQRPATDPLYVVAVTIGIAAYGWITWSGARELMHFGALSLAVAVLGSAIGQLVIGRQTAPGLSTWSLNALFALPLTTYAIALLKESFFAAKWRRLTDRRVESLYRLLGIAFFSLAVSLGLLLWKSQAPLDTLSRLSPCLSLAAALIVGLAIRLLPRGAAPLAKASATNREIAATAVTLIGAGLMVAAVVLAWPSPDRLIAVGVVNFVVLSWFGFSTGLAPLHFPALECLALTGLIAFHQFGEAVGGAGVSGERTLINTLLLGRSGVVVSLMSLLTTAIAAVLWRSGVRHRKIQKWPNEASFVNRDSNRPFLNFAVPDPCLPAKSYLAAAGGMAVLSLAIAGYAGFWPNLSQPSIDRSLATIVFVLFGIAGMIANERLNRIELAWAGAVVWLGVFLHALGWNAHVRGWLDAAGLLPNRPIVVGLLAFATWSLGCAVVGKVRNRFVTPWSAASGRATVVALFAMPWKVWGDFGPHAIYLGWVAALCLGQAHLWQSRNVFSLSQAVAFIAASLGVAAFAQDQTWWLAHGDELAAIVDVRHVHWQIAGLAAACVPWLLWRRLGGKFAVLARCCDWKVDRWIPPVLVITLLSVTWTGCWPLVMAQMPGANWLPTHWRWDRLALLLIGVGGASWALEEITRYWLFPMWRRDSHRNLVTTTVRFPWLAASLTFVFAMLMIAVPEAAWPRLTDADFGTPAILTSITRPYFAPTSWWAVSALALAAICGAACERRRVRSLVSLIVTAVSGLLLYVVRVTEQLDVMDALILWLTLGGLFAHGCVRSACEWDVRFNPTFQRRTKQSSARSLHGVIDWICLVPVLLLVVGNAEAHAMRWSRFMDLLEKSQADWSMTLILVLPLLLWSGWLLRTAQREKSATQMFAASHVICLTIVLTAFVGLWTHPVAIETRMVAMYWHWTTVGVALCSLGWVVWRDQLGPLTPSLFGPGLLGASVTPWLWQQVWSWGSACVVSLLVAALLLINPAHQDHAVLNAFGASASHLGWMLLIVAGCAAERCRTRVIPRTVEAGANPTELASVDSGPLHYAAQPQFLSREITRSAKAHFHRDKLDGVCVTNPRAGYQNVIGVAALCWVVTIAAATAGPSAMNADEGWRVFHVWILGWLVVALAWTLVAVFQAAWQRRQVATVDDALPTTQKHEFAVRWAEITLIGVALLCLREFVEFQSVVWPVSGISVIATCMAVLAIITRSQQRVAASMVSVVVATVMAWRPEVGGWLRRESAEAVTWWEAGLVAFALAALAWQIVEVWWQRWRGERFDLVNKVSACRQGARITLGAALIFVWGALLVHAGHRGLRDTREMFWDVHSVAAGLLWFGVAATFAVSAWDRFSKTTVAGIYGSIWLGLLLVFESRALPMSERWSVWVIGLIAADVALVGAAWWALSYWLRITTDNLQVSGKALAAGFEASDVADATPVASAIPLTASWRQRLDGAEGWLTNLQMAWALIASGLACIAVLSFAPTSLRMASVASVALLVPGLAAMACSGRRELFQQASLWLVAVTVVEFLWAWMEPQPRFDFWLQRSIRALEALGATVFVLSVLVSRLIPAASDWRRAVTRGAIEIGSAAGLALTAVLLQEAWWFDPINGCPITGPQIALVAVALVGLAAALLAIALRDGKFEISDPKSEISDFKFQISDFKLPIASTASFFTPQFCVYAAEVVIALLFLHLYLSMPELFRGYLQPYWPLIVMAIAFAGVGASELCQRAGLKVLSEPLQNSAALLPLIPALGFWVATSRTHYSTVLFVAGLAYVWLNLRRRSFWYVLGAALAGNAGLWSLWSEYGVALLVRPQVWLIPPAISVLAAAQWNRQRLTEAQLAAIRYPAITLIYVSSAGEMFLTGIAESFWLPVVLMVLSVGGVLAGIMLRVRSFLYLGASFLLLSLVSMVWHAADAINHTWPWWAFGIGLGLGVLTLFGLFERKRNEMLRLLGELKSWER